jgi:hypothetical protein
MHHNLNLRDVPSIPASSQADHVPHHRGFGLSHPEFLAALAALLPPSRHCAASASR